jgi:hypothetical protein
MDKIQKIVHFLSQQYKFDNDEAYEQVKLFQETMNVLPKKAKEQRHPKTILPFCGVIQEHWCQVVRKNYGLYTQCPSLKAKDGPYCKTCAKHAEKTDGVPINGEVSSLPHPKATNYALVMKKKNITREDAELAASQFGWKIPDEQFIETYKKRGRPKHNRKIISQSANPDCDDIIAKNIAQANNETSDTVDVPTKEPSVSAEKQNMKTKTDVEEKKPEELSEEPHDGSEEDDDKYMVEFYVSDIIIKGKKYLIDDESDALFDAETEEEIGDYNHDTGVIDWF